MPHIIEAEQGDSISGKISRAEVAQVMSQALEMPAAAGKGLHYVHAGCRNAHHDTLQQAQRGPRDARASTCLRYLQSALCSESYPRQSAIVRLSLAACQGESQALRQCAQTNPLVLQAFSMPVKALT